MTNMRSQTFHTYYDSAVATTTLRKQVTRQERELSYRFYTHFHPYAAELLRRLVKESVRGLQAADTDYQKNSDGTLVTLVGSTRVSLPGGTKVTLADGKQKILWSEIRVGIPDGTALTLGNGTQIKVPLSIPIGDNAALTVSGLTDRKGIPAKVTSNTSVALPDGTPVNLPAATPVSLLGGLPTPVLYEEIFSPSRYNPSGLVQRPYPIKDLDFTSGGAYAVYNWELFYHAPLIIAIHLSKNQRFEEAQRWFHYVFDPTDDSDGPTPERFWKVKPFQYTDVRLIEDILINLSTGDDRVLRQDTINSIMAWKDSPYRPHVVARYRQSAYMFKTVMAYLDNLIAWGDSLFRQDTGESINEATQVYVLAANILGQRPQLVPKKGSVRPQTYANLRADLDQFGNAAVNFETDILFDHAPHPNQPSESDRLGTLRSIGKALYFCIPRNDKLLSYWDTVADRLFKIHNSLNIQGIFRQLPLFEPPIDPALLARAVAAGVDVGATIIGTNQPLPLVRFQFLVQKAAEICQEVKSLGNNLLSAMEKEDGEAMAILRAKHERVVMAMVEHVKYDQLQEAIKSREGLLKSLALAVQRYTYYERQLGKGSDEVENAIPDQGELDRDGLDKMKFVMTEPEMKPREINVDIATDAAAQAAQALNGGKILSSYEVRESFLLEAAQLSSDIANILNTVSSAAHFVPEFKIHVQPVGLGATVEYGGKEVGDAVGATAAAARAIADRLNFEARRAGRIDSFARREREWAFQSNLAAGEITQVFKQLRAAEIREAITELELKNHRQQMKQAEEIERFLNEEGTERSGKKTNKALYAWMKREVRGLYGQCFQFAFDIAKKSERALQHELGNSELNFLQFGYLAGKEGLLSGERLYLDIKRMEMAYHELNQREYELTRHVSLLQVDPTALLKLRTTGRCTVFLPEELFDMDCPGHYFRRIKSIAVSIPCVTGPYTSVNCTLTLLKSSIRRNPSLRDGSYAREGMEDDRFSDHFGSLQAIVTSGGQSDSGLFETNLRDERYLPFENSGVVSQWQLELPADVRQFDYNTIADVILHFRYTAREGGDLLGNGAAANLKSRIEEAEMAGSVRLFSIRHEFPTEWARFKTVKLDNAQPKVAVLTLSLREEHYPFWSRGRLSVVKRMDLFASAAQDPVRIFEELGDATDLTKAIGELNKDTSYGDLRVGKLTKEPIAKPFDVTLALYLNDNKMQDLWLAITWGK